MSRFSRCHHSLLDCVPCCVPVCNHKAHDFIFGVTLLVMFIVTSFYVNYLSSAFISIAYLVRMDLT